MATTITKYVLENGPRNYIASYVFNSDGTAVTSYVAADPTSGGDMGVNVGGQTFYPGTHLKIWQLNYNLPANITVRLTWEATSAQDTWVLYGFGKQKFMHQGGLYVPQSGGSPITGATGKLDFNMPSFTGTGFGVVELWLKKDIQR